METDTTAGWSEEDSSTFLDLADVAVIGRREQIEVVLSLIPAEKETPFRVVDICCGDGMLSEAILERFSTARILGLDGSETMRREAEKRLSRFGDRFDIQAFDLDDMQWADSIHAPRCFVSSLAIHHLDAGGKRSLFRQIASRLESGGALLIADIVAPASDTALESHRASWRRAAADQSQTLTGSTELYDRAIAEGWGYYDGIDSDPEEQPSTLFEQLKWLEEAGFRSADCFWLRAGFAIYGGYV